MTSTAIGKPRFGLTGFLLALVAMVIAAIQVSAIMEPASQSAGVTIGEIAAEIRDAAQRRLSGQEAPKTPPAPDKMNITQILAIVGTVLATLGAIAGAVGLYKSEPKNLPMLAIGIGVGAIIMQYVFWLALIICAIVLMASVINNMDGILGST